ncbi:MAG: heme biosynthesis protein HemY [Betaproteobacteria bacterium]|nr:heme biosynthesis protein HemY [Betaproteobacteria bacterium]
MRTLFWLLAVFASAVALAIIGRGNEGYALFVYPPWRAELSLIFFFVLSAAAFAVFYLLARLVHHALQLPVHVRAYRIRRRIAKAQDALLGSAQAYLEGRFARAERDARQAFDAGESRALAALFAARAAHQLRSPERRDAWLEKAAESGDPLHIARLVTQAELLLEERDYFGARRALRDLHGSGPKHIATQRLLLRAELGARNWEEVLRLTGMLAKRDAISPALHDEYRSQALIELLGALSSDPAGLEARWRRLAARDQISARVAAAAARHAATAGRAGLAREMIEKALMQDWNRVLVDLYGTCAAEDVRMRIVKAEHWLLAHPQDAHLLLALGRLCVRGELWGKAQNYLEASLSFDPTREVHLALAHLFERLDKPADASRHFRHAAEAPG